MKTLTAIIFAGILTFLLAGCIEDGIDTSPSAQPDFSVDTLDIGVVFTEQPTATSRFMVYNRNSKIINISDISLRSGERVFRLNVDGFSGDRFNDIEIRPKDSIYVFVEATLRPNGLPALTEITDVLDFTTNGVTKSVVLSASGQDVRRLKAEVIDRDTRFDAMYPYQIFDSLVVDEGVTLTVSSGAKLYFHDKARFIVKGTLITEGTADAQVDMTGDRMGNVVGSIPFDLMASQWHGLEFAPCSQGNSLSHTVVRNTVSGVLADSLSQVAFLNCRLRNSAGYALESRYADLSLIGCELAEAADGVVCMIGGKVVMNHCTIANYYLFSALRGPSLYFSHFSPESDNGSGMPYLAADISNTIIYGNGTDLSESDFTGCDVVLRRCLLKSRGSDDDNFINCIWDTDPLYYTVRQDYYFDYRLQPESPAIGVADPALTLVAAERDFYGTIRGDQPNLGAYQASKD